MHGSRDVHRLDVWRQKGGCFEDPHDQPNRMSEHGMLHYIFT